MTKSYIVVAYDVSDDHRRRRVAHILEDYGERVQYSVFDCLLAPKDLVRLERALSRVIEPNEDSVRFYRLCSPCADRIGVLGLGRVLRPESLRIV